MSLPTETLVPLVNKTVIELLTTGGVLKGTFEFSGWTGPKMITNAQIVAAVGAQTDFLLRAYFERSGFRSLNYDQITVRKV